MSTSTKAPPRPRNTLLRHLSNEDLALVQGILEPVELGFRKRLQSANRRIQDIYFPESGLASVVAIGGGERKQAEVAIIGREGFVGIPIVLASDRSPHEIFMQIEGVGQRASTSAFRSLLDQSSTLLQSCLRYAHVYSIQCSYTALANAHGRIEERLARWLLMAEDRIQSPELLLTHDFLALMLGVRRAGVTVALHIFESRAVISTSRGAITILDRDGLVEAAGGLYGPPEAELERLFNSMA